MSNCIFFLGIDGFKEMFKHFAGYNDISGNTSNNARSDQND